MESRGKYRQRNYGTQQDTCILIKVAIAADGNAKPKLSRKESKIQEFMYRGTKNVEDEMYDHTGNKWSHWNGNRRFER